MGVPTADLDDATSEVFLRASRVLSGFRGGASHTIMKAWLRGFARLIALELYKQRKRRREDLHPPETMPHGAGVEESVEDELVEHERLRARVLEAQAILEEIGPEHAEILSMREREGMTLDEIAAELGVDERSVRRRLKNAKEAVEKSIKRRRGRNR